MVISKKKSIVLSNIQHRVLRNGKILISKKKNTIKKKLLPKEKINNKLYFIKTSSKCISNSKVKNNNEIMVPSYYNHIFDNRHLNVTLTKLPPSMFNDHNNKNNNTNYTKLEDSIPLNELQMYTEIESKIEKCHMLSATKESKHTHMISNSFYNKSVPTAETSDHLVVNQTSDVRITREKKIKLQIEERKQLDKKLVDKLPNNTFNKVYIQLYDIKEQIQFFRTLGLRYRIKCPLTLK